MIPLETFQHALSRVEKSIFKTPLVESSTLSRMFQGEVYLKLENLQKTGSFKIRGAMNKVLGSREKIPALGVVAASAGNHAQGVALAAQESGIPSTIVMPQWASISKQEATRSYGGQVVISGQSLEDSVTKAIDLAGEGRLFIHPFDDPDIIAGQGTIALEILSDLKDTDRIVIPVGGGGLAAGISAAAKQIRPSIRIVGVQASACRAAYDSFKQGKVIKSEAASSLADGISVKQVGELPFEIFTRFVDQMVLVEEEQIASAMLFLLERKKILAEGAGAVGLAAVLSGLVGIPEGSRTVVVVSGGNVDSPLLGRIIHQGLLKNGRLIRLKVKLEDKPGSLACLLGLVAELKANVLHIYHDRSAKDLPMLITRVEMELETRGPTHGERLVEVLKAAGYEFDVL